MEYTEIYGDLFSTECEHLAHCISADYALGAGIAVQFNKRFNMREKLVKIGSHTFPDVILIGNVFNLVTKKLCWNKPTKASLRKTIVKMREMAVEKGIKEIAMPKIGAGLDRLAWMDVSDILKDVFKDTDIHIFVYIY